MDPAHSAHGRASTPSSTSSIPTPPQRTNSQSSLTKPAHLSSHRQSFVEGLRNPPPSPRGQRHPSFTQAALQELFSHPPSNRHPNPRFAGRDWRNVTIGELLSQDEVKWADMDTSVEEATMVLLKSVPRNIVLIREDASSPQPAISTFDYNDLNAYLLVVVGLAKPEEDQAALFRDIQHKAQGRVAIPLRHIQPLCRKESLVTLPSDCDLADAIEVFGSGIHRILVTNYAGDVVGVFSQLRVLEFFWNEGVNFPVIDKLYPVVLRDLGVGTQQIMAINADSPLADALTLMNNEGLTSVAVVDSGANVVGNISTADLRHLTSAASLPLLHSSCMHFISVILSERGVEEGRDSFPVFYVNPYSTLAHTVAKLVATRAHRMWVVESASPSPSQPATPLAAPASVLVPAGGSSASSTATTATSAGSSASAGVAGSNVLVPNASTTATPASMPMPMPADPGAGAGAGASSAPPSPGFAASVPAAALPGAHLSGRLTGVISLTDILNLFARSSGLKPADPGEQRARRRRSSSSSVRPSLEGSRPTLDFRR